MNRLILILGWVVLTSCDTSTHGVSKKDSDDKDYMKIVYQHCPNPDIIEVESTRDNYIEIEYICDGNRYEIGIQDNEMMFIEQNISVSEIPFDIIKNKLDKQYSGWMIDEVSHVTRNDTSFLKVEILKDGIEQNVYFTKEGKKFKIKPVDITTRLDFDAIAKNEKYISSEYRFNDPDTVYEMPDLLREISGIALSGENTIYCVQDELGSVFKYDLRKEKIVRAHRFTDVGDFEDLAINQNTIYVLRSDGNLFIYDLENKSKTRQFMLETNSLNCEGIYFSKGYLYVVSKEALINHPETKRMIYRVKADDLEHIEKYFEIDIPGLNTFLTENFPSMGTSKFEFNPSAIAIHPITGDIYILSASDRFIAIYRDQKLVNAIPLSAEVYYKPEGLAFYENGDLLISSEGDKKGFSKGSINRIKQK